MRKPGYAIAAWVMLGLAIAANAAVFAIVWGFLLKPLPYAQPNQLSVVRERVPGIGLNTPLVSNETYLALKQKLSGIANAGLTGNSGSNVARIKGQPRLLRTRQSTPSMFRTLGVEPVLGRWPVAAAGKPGGPPEAVISWHFWQSAYGGSRNVVHQSFKVEGKAYRIVGVMPRGFTMGFSGQDAWLPYVMTPERARNGNINYLMIVRRKSGVSSHELNLDLKNYVQRLLAGYMPKRRALDIRNGYTIDARGPRSVALGQSGVGHLPWLLQAAAGLLLLLALANTINLGLVRQRARQHEFALRRVLGASRGGLVRLILLEHVPIALAVGGVATLLAWVAIHALHAFGLPPAFSPFKVELAAPVVILAWVLTLLSILIAAFGPALLATGRRLLRGVGQGPTMTGGKRSHHLQRTLGTVQIALACALVIAGGLLGASLWRVLSQPLGFSPTDRVAMRVVLPASVTSNTAAWATLKPQLLEVAGVRNAALGVAPFSTGRSQGGISKIGAKHGLIVNMPSVSASYFSTLGIRFMAGRAYTPAKIANHASVIIINESLAKRFFGGADKAIGKSLAFSAPRLKNPRIVGVTRNLMWAPTPDEYQPGTAYLPRGVFPAGFNLVVHTAPLSEVSTSTLKHAVQKALPGSVVFRVTSLPKMVQGASIFRAAGAGMVGAFAALALLLAALGVFAITSFIARARLGEYGIRAALGASPLALLRLGFKEAAWLLAIGLPIGWAGAYLLGRVIAGALYQTPVLDPWLYIVGAALIAAVVFAAAWRPARKAARVPIRDLLGGGGR
jgi:predicted permease